MWLPDDQEFPVSTLVLSSVGGSVVGAVIGGFLEGRSPNASSCVTEARSIIEYAPLRYIFITQVAFGTLMQLIHFFVVPETRSTIILDREAKKRRLGGENVYGPNELDKEKLSAKDLANIYLRPFKMRARACRRRLVANVAEQAVHGTNRRMAFAPLGVFR